MVARGRVHNGVVVLDKGVCLPEGQEVTVLTPETVPTNARLEGSCPHSVLDIPTVRVGAVLRPLTSEPHEFFDHTGAYDAYGLSKLLVKLDECAP